MTSTENVSKLPTRLQQKQIDAICTKLAPAAYEEIREALGELQQLVDLSHKPKALRQHVDTLFVKPQRTIERVLQNESQASEIINIYAQLAKIDVTKGKGVGMFEAIFALRDAKENGKGKGVIKK